MKLISHIIKKEVEKLKRKNFLTENRFNYLRLDNNERILPLKKNDLKIFLGVTRNSFDRFVFPHKNSSTS